MNGTTVVPKDVIDSIKGKDTIRLWLLILITIISARLRFLVLAAIILAAVIGLDLSDRLCVETAVWQR